MTLLKSPKPSRQLETVMVEELSKDDLGANKTTPPGSVCFHCLEAIPKYSSLFATIDGQEQAMCCYGCKSVAEFIDANALSDFYSHREQQGVHRFFAKVAGHEVSDELMAQWSYLDTPEDQSDYVVIDALGNRSIELMVSGLYCSSCSWLIDSALTQLSEAIQVRIQLDAKRVQVFIAASDPTLKMSRILALINGLGYHAEPLAKYSGIEQLDKQRALERQQAIKRILVAGFGMMQVMTYAVGLYLGELQGMDSQQHRFLTLVSMLVATVVVFYSGKPFFVNAFNDLSNRHFGMDVPIAFAIAGAYFPSVIDTLMANGENIYFDSAVMFIFFLLLGRFVEMRARHRLSDAPDAIKRLLPTRIAIQRFMGSELLTLNIKPQEVQAKDQMVLKDTAVVPFDSLIVGGEARIDESLLTGEVEPVHKGAGDVLLAGSKLVSGLISVAAKHAWSESSIVKIENMLGDGLSQQRSRQSGLQRFSQIFVLAVLALTLVVGIAWWFYDASRVFEIVLAMLIASCPCAFALALPIGSAAASNALRKHGVLLANPPSLETLATVTEWCFDKTGTLTRGKASIEKVITLAASTETECVVIAAALEQHSRHPLASAFAMIEPQHKVSALREFAGNGISGIINNTKYFLGKRDWVITKLEASVEIELPPRDSYCSEVVLATSSKVLAVIFVADQARPGAAEFVSFLKSNNKKVSILSGDGQQAVQACADKLHISQAIGDLLPEQKKQFIANAHYEHKVLAMVGDGLNDAPVMAHADISIALSSGSEITQSQADVVLLNERLDALIVLHHIAKKSKRVTQQNLAWALSYNVIVLPLAAFGYLTPWVAALGMSASSLLVVLNALRIRAANSTLASRPTAGAVASESSL